VTPEACWQELREFVTQQIDNTYLVHKHAVETGDRQVFAPLGGILSAHRSTLSKMTELEAGR
jgi:hypothetical protein